jgi:hypothetical protein
MEIFEDALFDDENKSTVTITLEDNTEIECVVLSIFEAGERNYIAVLPEEENEEESQVYLYRYEEEDGTPILTNIETDEEYEIVADTFDEILDEEEFYEMNGEDEIE